MHCNKARGKPFFHRLCSLPKKKNGAIYKVKGTKDFLSAAYSNIFTKSKGGFYHEEKCF